MLEAAEGADAVHRLLHLAMPAVATLHGVGGGGEQGVVEEGESFFKSGAEDLLQGLADALETPNASPESAEPRERRGGSAASVEEPVDLVHDLAKRSEFGHASGDPGQRAPLDGAELLLDEEVAMLKEVGHSLLKEVILPYVPFGLGTSGASRLEGRDPAAQSLPCLGYSPKHGFG
jgi:hypothetical protein